MGTVFICYRRELAAGDARALFNDLVEKLGKDAVFMDVDNIALGRDFRAVLQETLASCDLMLVLIGRDWASAKDETGRLRLENSSDFVRLEISAALKRNIRVTPVLVQGARMPAAEQLPEDIRELVYRSGFEVSHSRWESDVQEMARRLGLGQASPSTAKPTRRRLAVAAASLLAVVAVSGGLLYYYHLPTSQIADGQASGTDADTNAERSKYIVYLHTGQRPQPDIRKVEDALIAAGYKVSGDNKSNDLCCGVDYSIRDSEKNYEPAAGRMSDIIENAIGVTLPTRSRRDQPAGTFGIWF